MASTISVSNNANPLSARPNDRTQSIARMSDGTLVVWWWEDGATGGSARWRRFKSTDAGATWTEVPPVVNLTLPALIIAQDGDTIYGLELSQVSANIVKWVYSAGSFTDTRVAYVWTNPAITTFYATSCAAAADTVKGAMHVLFTADSGGSTYTYLIAIDKATGTKLTELRFATTTYAQAQADLTIDQLATPKLWLAYTLTGQTVTLRSYTFSGTAYTLADAEETVHAVGQYIGAVAIALDGGSPKQPDVFYADYLDVLRTKKRTGVATYSAATTLSTHHYDWRWNDLSISEYGNAAADLILFQGGDGAVGYLTSMKRIGGVWGAETNYTTGNDLVVTSIRKIQGDLKAHTFSLSTSTPTYENYDSLGVAVAPSVDQSIYVLEPATNPPTITASFICATPGDSLAKYHVIVKRVSDGVTMWNTGAATPGAPTLADGGAGLLSAGVYRYQVTFVGEWGGETPGPEATITLAASHQTNLSNITVGPAGTVSRKIYRTQAGGAAGTGRLVTTIANNTATTYTDNATDASIAAAAQVPTTDTMAVGTAYTGPKLTTGQVFTLLYAGTALVADGATQYSLAIQFSEAIEGRFATLGVPSIVALGRSPAPMLASVNPDAANGRNRVTMRLRAPLSTEATGSWALTRRPSPLAGIDPLGLTTVPVSPDTKTAIVNGLWNALTKPTTQTGFSAYRQCPTLGLARNLVINGGTVNAHGWTLPAGYSVVADSTSVTGWAIRLVATAGPQPAFSTQDIPIEAGKVYSIAVQEAGDVGNYVLTYYTWLDASGTAIGVKALVGAGNYSAAAYAEQSTINLTAPGNARTLRITLENAASGASAILKWSAIRVFQSATAAVWVAAHQQFIQRGLSIYEAATNLLTNGDVETALSGVVDGFNDGLANLNAWTTISGSPSVTANLVTLNNAFITAGHPEWWDIAAGTQFRFKWVTGGTLYVYLRYADANNWVRWVIDGAVVGLQKNVAGVNTGIGSNVAAVLTNGNFYWLSPSITGSTANATILANDNAGAVGTTVATHAGAAFDASLANGVLGFQGAGGVALQVGGNFANVVRVSIAAPPSWAPYNQFGGVGAYCVSKLNRFTGTYSLSIKTDATSPQCSWAQTLALGSAQRVVSARARCTGAQSATIRLSGAGTNDRAVTAVTNDWVALTGTASVTDTCTQIQLFAASNNNTIWWDNVALTAGAYDTMNADPSGQAYNVGARTISNVQLPLPTGFSLSDFAAVGVYRPDHAVGRGTNNRMLLDVFIDTSNRLLLYVSTATTINWYKARAAVTGFATDSGVTAFTTGDTIAWGVRCSTTAGLVLYLSKNGGAVATYTLAGAEQLLSVTGTPTISVGRAGDGAGNAEQDGTTGVVRILKGGLSDATISALVANPYADPDDNDLAVWSFEGVTHQVPTVNDHLIKQGVSYDYLGLTVSAANSAETPPAVNVDQVTLLQSRSLSQGNSGPWTLNQTCATQNDWWLKDYETPANNLKLIAVDRAPFTLERQVFLGKPLVGGPEVAVRAPAMGGMQRKHKAFHAANPLTVEAQLRTLLNSPDTLYVQDPFGQLAKVVFRGPVRFDPHEGILELEFDTVEVI